MSEPILTIRNHHVAACGDPSIVNDDSRDSYIGYFENSFGEQWIFVRCRKTGSAVLGGGDVGWELEVEVVAGHAHDLNLGEAEQRWLAACWLASEP